MARRWSLLQQVFDVYKMCFGVDGKQLDVYKEVAAILKDSDFRPRLEILRVASKCIGKHARWMMGCDCHEAALEGIKYRSKRRAKLISLGVVDGVCPWACRRGVALACGRVDSIVDDIANFARRLDVRFLAIEFTSAGTCDLTGRYIGPQDQRPRRFEAKSHVPGAPWLFVGMSRGVFRPLHAE